MTDGRRLCDLIDPSRADQRSVAAGGLVGQPAWQTDAALPPAGRCIVQVGQIVKLRIIFEGWVAFVAAWDIQSVSQNFYQ